MADTVRTGALAADQDTVELDTGHSTGVSVVVSGTFVGTILLEQLFDTTEGWVAASCFTRGAVTATASLTAPGNRFMNASPAVAVRARAHPWTSGSASITLATAEGISLGLSMGGAGGPVTIADGADAAEGTTADVGIITDIGGTVIGFLRGAILRWNTFLSRLPAALVGGRLDVNLGAAPATVTATATLAASAVTAGNVGGVEGVLSATFTRPADTNTYAANDCISNSTSAPVALTFANAALTTGHGGVVLGATIIDEANQTLPLSATLHLFSAIPTSTNDNAALALSTADLANYLGSVKFTTASITNAASGASGSIALTGALQNPLPYKCAATSLFGVLQANNSYLPISGEVFIVILSCSLDA